MEGNNDFALSYLKKMQDVQFRAACVDFLDKCAQVRLDSIADFARTYLCKIALLNIHYTWQENKDKPNAKDLYRKLSADILTELQKIHAPEVSATNNNQRSALRI